MAKRSRSKNGRFTKGSGGGALVVVQRRSPARRSAPRKVQRRRRSGRSGGGGMGWIPRGDELRDGVAAGVYGFLEGGFVRKDGIGFQVLSAIPKPIDALGFTGNIAVIARAAAIVTKSPYLRNLARATAQIAFYKLAKRGKLYTSATDVSGEDDDYESSGYEDGFFDPADMIPG